MAGVAYGSLVSHYLLFVLSRFVGNDLLHPPEQTPRDLDLGVEVLLAGFLVAAVAAVARRGIASAASMRIAVAIRLEGPWTFGFRGVVEVFLLLPMAAVAGPSSGALAHR